MFDYLAILYLLASVTGLISHKLKGSLYYVINTVSYLFYFTAAGYSAIFLYTVGYSGSLLDKLCLASVVAGIFQLMGLLLLLNPKLRRMNTALANGEVEPSQVKMGAGIALPVLLVTAVTTVTSIALLIIFAMHYL